MDGTHPIGGVAGHGAYIYIYTRMYIHMWYYNIYVYTIIHILSLSLN